MSKRRKTAAGRAAARKRAARETAHDLRSGMRKMPLLQLKVSTNAAFKYLMDRKANGGDDGLVLSELQRTMLADMSPAGMRAFAVAGVEVIREREAAGETVLEG